MLPIDLSGKRALVAGVADDGGFGFAVAKAFAEAGASVCVATWPPALNIFLNLLERGKMDESRQLSDGSLLTFEKIYPLDAAFDSMSDVPADVRENKRYKDHNDFSVDGVVNAMIADFGAQPVDIVFHSLANGPEVKKPLLETSRGGYLSAIGTSAYSLVSMVQRFGPIMRPGGSFCSLTYMASERMIPGYGGGMSTAKAALESDTRVLSFEAGPQIRRPREHDFRGSVRVARGECDRHHRQDGAILHGEFTVARSTHDGGSWQHRRVPGERARLRRYRHHDLRGQGIPLDGNGSHDARGPGHPRHLTP